MIGKHMWHQIACPLACDLWGAGGGEVYVKCWWMKSSPKSTATSFCKGYELPVSEPSTKLEKQAVLRNLGNWMWIPVSHVSTHHLFSRILGHQLCGVKGLQPRHDHLAAFLMAATLLLKKVVPDLLPVQLHSSSSCSKSPCWVLALKGNLRGGRFGITHTSWSCCTLRCRLAYILRGALSSQFFFSAPGMSSIKSECSFSLASLWVGGGRLPCVPVVALERDGQIGVCILPAICKCEREVLIHAELQWTTCRLGI